MARLLDRSYRLRCLVFHNISAISSPFTSGIRVTVSPVAFENALQFVRRHYVPVSLDDILSNYGGHGLPSRSILVTFDDAYASVVEVAAPLCKKYGIPAIFFVNAAFIDNLRLAPDNLVCYVANRIGMKAVNAAIRAVPGLENVTADNLADVFGIVLPPLSLKDRELFLNALYRLAAVEQELLAKDANLYLTSGQLRELATFGIEIGNHTYTHPHCRSLSDAELAAEIGENKIALEAISGRPVRSFSQPYGSSQDLTDAVQCELRRSGHKAVFLSESVANQENADLLHLDRVSTCAERDESLFFELEILPRLRSRRNQFRRSAHRTRMAKHDFTVRATL
jgi:peptidoglycan/xylan/chitin deacetylase (PgdA/CDA1 family)